MRNPDFNPINQYLSVADSYANRTELRAKELGPLLNEAPRNLNPENQESMLTKIIGNLSSSYRKLEKAYTPPKNLYNLPGKLIKYFKEKYDMRNNSIENAMTLAYR